MRTKTCTGTTRKGRQCLRTGAAIKFPKPGGTILERCYDHMLQTDSPIEANMFCSSEEEGHDHAGDGGAAVNDTIPSIRQGIKAVAFEKSAPHQNQANKRQTSLLESCDAKTNKDNALGNERNTRSVGKKTGRERRGKVKQRRETLLKSSGGEGQASVNHPNKTIPVERMAQLEIGDSIAQSTHGHPLLAFEHKLQSRDTASEQGILGRPMVEARDRQIKASTSHKTDLRKLLTPSSRAVPMSAKIDTLAHVAASGLERLNIHDADAHILAGFAADTEATMIEQVKLWQDQTRHNLAMQRTTQSGDKRLAELELQGLRHDARIKQLEDMLGGKTLK